MSHRHQSIIDKAIGVHNTAGIWQRHREINAQLAENMSCANSRHQSPMRKSESLAPFMGIMWQTVILHLHYTLSCTVSTGKEEYDYAIVESMQRGTLAAQEALSCMEQLSQCNSLKVRIPFAFACMKFASYQELTYLTNSFTLSLSFLWRSAPNSWRHGKILRDRSTII